MGHLMGSVFDYYLSSNTHESFKGEHSKRESAGSCTTSSNIDSEVATVIHLTLFTKCESLRPTHLQGEEK